MIKSQFFPSLHFWFLFNDDEAPNCSADIHLFKTDERFDTISSGESISAIARFCNKDFMSSDLIASRKDVLVSSFHTILGVA